MGESAPKAPFGGPLQGEIKTEVAIVGGGITGLTAAMLLSRAGKHFGWIDF